MEKRTISRRMWKWLAETRPDATSLLREKGITEVEIEEAPRRACIRFLGLDVPEHAQDMRWEGFDKRAGTTQACIIVDGTMEDQYTRVVHMGRRLLRRSVTTGDRVWIDPKVMHHEESPDMGPHSEERDAKVRVERYALRAKLVFVDGWMADCDVDELRAWRQCWVDKEQQ